MMTLGLSMIVSILCFSQSPVITVVTILIMVAYLSVWMFALSNISFYSYVTFLVFLGGLMILFTYMCSLASNEKSFFGLFNLNKVLISVGLLSGSYYMLEMEKATNFFNSIFYPTINFFFCNTELMYYYLFIYLLFTLFVAVILSKKKEGAIRMKAI